MSKPSSKTPAYWYEDLPVPLVHDCWRRCMAR